MSLQDSQARLDRALKELQFRWDQLESVWQDANRRHLDKTYMQPLAKKCRKACAALEYMDLQMQRARRECE